MLCMKEEVKQLAYQKEKNQKWRKGYKERTKSKAQRAKLREGIEGKKEEEEGGERREANGCLYRKMVACVAWGL